MPTHSINVHPSKPLAVDSADLKIEVTEDGAKLGELRVSRGSIDWVPRSHSSGWRMSWSTFDAMMRDNGSPIRRRR